MYKKIVLVFVTCVLVLALTSCNSSKMNIYGYKSDNLYGYIDQKGAVILEPQYDTAFPFYNGFALVVKDDRYTFIDESGNQFNQWYEGDMYLYNVGMQFSKDGFAKIYHSDSQTTTIINTKGTELFETELKIFNETYYENNLIPAYYYKALGQDEDKCVFINEFGEEILDDNYQHCLSFNNGLAAVMKDYEIIFIDLDGNTVIQNNYISTISMFDGEKPVTWKDGYAIMFRGYDFQNQEESRYEVINQKGEVVFQTGDERVYDIIDGFVLTVNELNQIAIYDFEGNVVLDYYYKINKLYNHGMLEEIITIFDPETEKYGAYDICNGTILIPTMYEFLSCFIDGYAVAMHEGSYFIVNERNEIVSDEYSNIISVQTSFRVYENRINKNFKY